MQIKYNKRQVIWHDASRSHWQEYVLEIGEILHIFPSGTQSMGDRDPKRLIHGSEDSNINFLIFSDFTATDSERKIVQQLCAKQYVAW